MKFVVNESNIHTLYHFTCIINLPYILKDNKLKSNDTQRGIRNGKRYISFTRHKSSLEGFATPNYCNVRIVVDADKMNSINRYGGTKPFEYYTKDKIKKHPEFYPEYNDNKDLKNATHPYNYFEMKKTDGYYGDEEFYNQAEESLEMDKNSIENLDKFVNRIDICLIKHQVTDPIYRYNLRALDDILKNCDSQWLDKIFVYTNETDFAHQTNKCITLQEYFNGQKKQVYKKVDESKLVEMLSECIMRYLC